MLSTCGWVAGCGSGVKNVGVAPQITSEPQSSTVPLGGNATFSVSAGGAGLLSYQWSENGVAIPGATSSTYSAPVGIGDEQAIFTAVVSNAYGSSSSTAASLTVGPRSPKAGDLRFQQVDAASTAPGYTSIVSPENILPLQQFAFPVGTGIPLAVGPGCSGAILDVSQCGWLVYAFNLPANVVGLGVNYGSFTYAQMNGELSALEIPNTVITGMDIEPNYGSFAASWAQTDSPGVFDAKFRTFPATAISIAASQEAVQGRVITAVSFNGGQISYLSYGWSGEVGTVYECSVVLTTKTGAASVAVQLAGSGYIITAIGGNDVDGVILVGTRVQGDSLARPILIVPGGQSPDVLPDEGYSIVGLIYSGALGFIAWIGER